MTVKVNQANAEDIVFIKQWLRSEYDEDQEGFWCNWNIIQDAFDDSAMLVAYVDGDAVAFLVGERDFLSVSILCTKKTHRGRGVGPRLYRHFEQHAIELGNLGCMIQRKPSTSIGFWNKMGFRDTPRYCAQSSSPWAMQNDAIKINREFLSVSSGGIREVVDFILQDEGGDRIFEQRVGAVVAYLPGGEVKIQLEESVCLASPNSDLYLAVEVGSKPIISPDKLKRSPVPVDRRDPFWIFREIPTLSGYSKF